MLTAHNIGMRFGNRVVLRGLGFSLAPGSLAAVVGGNGAGKSTLLKLVAGLLAPSAGAVTWTAGSAPVSGRGLGWMCGLAAPDAPLPRELTALENLEFIARLRGLPQRRPGLLAHLTAWGLGARAHDYAGELSSGLRMRLQLAAATLHEPAILLLDEPAANLDPAGRALLEQALRDQRARGVALLATNDHDEAGRCDARIEVAAVARA